ncbi:MAG TPA: DUF1440 domain-containing protein [Candidatus Sulfotelmatobacter sp.]|jgi:hypothetical protein|nr:DUF1440 domain-containing protein [Candidatus Sulfotelmatobacter sp.]
MKTQLPRLRETRSAWKGALAGVIAGAAATVVMTQFQNAWNWTSERLKSNEDQSQKPQAPKPQESGENATSKVAGSIAALAGHELSHQEKEKGGALVHYGFGTTVGTVYGLTMEMTARNLKPQRALAGLGFGTALFLAADEVMVPALGLSEKPGEQPLGSHIYGLVSHLVYGIATEGFRGLVRRFL